MTFLTIPEFMHLDINDKLSYLQNNGIFLGRNISDGGSIKFLYHVTHYYVELSYQINNNNDYPQIYITEDPAIVEKFEKVTFINLPLHVMHSNNYQRIPTQTQFIPCIDDYVKLYMN